MTPSTAQERFTLITTTRDRDRDEFSREVIAGLMKTPKSLPCRFFYDRQGSRLFEAISELPEYYLTRAEREILRERTAEIISQIPERVRLVELGSGSAVKTRPLIEAFLRRHQALVYMPVDISHTMLVTSSLNLLREYSALKITAIAAEYYEGLRKVNAVVESRKLILWLGSSVGNLEREEASRFLHRLRDIMSLNDRLLVGIDLRKDRAVLERAYDDSQGVTAQFNLNVLTRINRELGGHFDLGAFRHRAVYNQESGRVEMYLVSARAQRVLIDRLELEVEFVEGETIHTEHSYKYSLAEIDALAEAAGLCLAGQWFDSDRRFSVNLLAPVESYRPSEKAVGSSANSFF